MFKSKISSWRKFLFLLFFFRDGNDLRNFDIQTGNCTQVFEDIGCSDVAVNGEGLVARCGEGSGLMVFRIKGCKLEETEDLIELVSEGEPGLAPYEEQQSNVFKMKSALSPSPSRVMYMVSVHCGVVSVRWLRSQII